MSEDIVGTRVGATQSKDDDEWKFFGFGVYEGDFPLPGSEEIIPGGMPNPRIKLDNGEVVWGAECWWGSEENTKAEMARYKGKITNVSIESVRREATGESVN
jgi:hypothetical protein